VPAGRRAVRAAKPGWQHRARRRRSGLYDPQKTIEQAIARAERVLPGVPAPEGEEDPRWQAILEIRWFLEDYPEPVWAFVARWGKHANADLRTAIGVCLLEHLLEYHFELVFPRVKKLSRQSVRFGSTFQTCRKLGQAMLPRNEKRFDALAKELRRPRPRRR
jgi:hypothetical protein